MLEVLYPWILVIEGKLAGGGGRREFSPSICNSPKEILQYSQR